jgi:predicted dehydrogenase
VTLDLNRRKFLKASAAATALSAASWNRVLGANERIRVGLIGFGLIGRAHTRNFMAQPDCQIAAVAETFAPRLEAACQLIGGGVQRFTDFRRLLESKAIDAIVVATPDHWHALMTMMACAAGKDVYVEKPLTLFVREGRWMIDVARRHKRVVQVGTQQRSGPHYGRAKELIRAGQIGDVVSVQCNFFRNVRPGFGNPPDQAAPADLDWDMWLGPSPQRAYNPNRALYHFRWFWNYSGGQMTNLGHHSLDIAHWITGVKGPKSVVSCGGRMFLKDNGEVPDVQDVIIEYPGFHAVCQVRECAAAFTKPNTGGMQFHGTKGSMTLGRTGFEIDPDRKNDPTNIVAGIGGGGHPVGGPQPVPYPEGQTWTEALKDSSGDAKQQNALHVRNFLDCIKSRAQPVSDLESSHQVSTVCHLSNISLRLGRKLNWDAEKEEIVGDAEANQWLTRPYRKPWDQELLSLLA